jgi:type I restriction enzyme, S subunit
VTGWPQVALGDVLRVKHGFAFKGEFFQPEGEQLVLTPGNFKIGGGLQQREGKERFYAGPYPQEFRLEPGDLLVAMTDLTQNSPILGSPLVVPSDGVFLHNQRLGKVEILDDRHLDRGFAYYLFVSDLVRSQLRGSATGSTVRHTAPGRIYSVRVRLPPLTVQQRIAAILSAYDDLMENSSRRLRLLEEMAQRIYREWFVDFRYPGHEDVPLVDSELGLIPEGWVVLPASEALVINPKITVERTKIRPFVPMASLSETGMNIGIIENRAGTSGARFHNGDTLFARITPCLENGKTAYVQCLAKGEVASGSTEFIVLRSSRLCSEYAYLLARSDQFRSHAIKSMSGATGRQRVRDECFQSLLLPVPTDALLQTFAALVAPLFQLSYRLFTANATLRSARDLLLPRLVSGEMDVTDLDIAVPETAA